MAPRQAAWAPCFQGMYPHTLLRPRGLIPNSCPPPTAAHGCLGPSLLGGLLLSRWACLEPSWLQPWEAAAQVDADLLVLEGEWRLGPAGRGQAWVPLCRAPGAPSESSPGSHRGKRLAHRALAPGGRGESNNYWKGKAVVSLLSKYLWKPQEAAGGRAGPRGARLGRPSGRARPLHPARLCLACYRLHAVPERFTPGRAIAALSGVKCNLPEIKPNYGIS